jgi:beta-glucosidase
MINPPKPLDINYSPELINKTSETADIAIITIGRNSGETADRKVKDDFMLSESEIKMIDNTCKIYHSKGKKVIVVLNIGGVIETKSWKNLPDAILLAWQGGQEAGNSVTDIITGKINPSGKLPMTFPNDINDHKSSLNFPMKGEQMSINDIIYGIQKKEKAEDEKIKNKDYTLYEEGIYVGYRHFDKDKLDVSYPFGYGLSYTKFELNDLKAIRDKDIINIEIKVSNIGTTPGKEVIQVYSSKPDSDVDRPIKELRAFIKTSLLNPGQSSRLKMQIPQSELSYWSENESQWVLENGIYYFNVGNSSRTLPLNIDVEIK